jgi:hypothetical protein
MQRVVLLRRTTVLMIFTPAQTRLYRFVRAFEAVRRRLSRASSLTITIASATHWWETRRRCSFVLVARCRTPLERAPWIARSEVNSCCGSTFSAKKRAYQSLVLNVIYRALVERMIGQLSQSRVFSRSYSLQTPTEYAPLPYVPSDLCVWEVVASVRCRLRHMSTHAPIKTVPVLERRGVTNGVSSAEDTD